MSLTRYGRTLSRWWRVVSRRALSAAGPTPRLFSLPLFSSSPVDYWGSHVRSRTSLHDTTPAAFASISQGRGHSTPSCGRMTDTRVMTPNGDTCAKDDGTD